VKAGAPIKLEVPFEAAPMPSIVWTRDDAQVPKDTAHVNLISQEGVLTHLAEVHIPISERTDSGTYKIVLTNEYGTCQAECKVTVLG
jgi:hypothetical protein